MLADLDTFRFGFDREPPVETDSIVDHDVRDALGCMRPLWGGPNDGGSLLAERLGVTSGRMLDQLLSLATGSCAMAWCGDRHRHVAPLPAIDHPGWTPRVATVAARRCRAARA